ncbi:MAG: CofH family radical SAM protein [Pirellulales bacterium]
MDSNLAKLLDKAVAGERLTPDEGLRLLESHDLCRARQGRRCRDAAAPSAAVSHVQHRPQHQLHERLHGGLRFLRVLSRTEARRRLHAATRRAVGKVSRDGRTGRRSNFVTGGLHHEHKLEWYEEMLADIKRATPSINIHGFSPPEIHHFTKLNKLPLRTVLERLKAAGLGSLPGGGAEILVDRVRAAMTRGKVMTDDWLNVNRVWHELGGISTATMMFGHIETLAERIEHLDRLRSLQDETSGFTAFICWTFQPEHTEMANVPPSGAFEYLKTQAVARLYLDNIPNIQSSWVTQGLKIGQLALLYGANDMGSLMIEENVVSSAGTVHYLSLNEMRDAIRELGYEPRRRNVWYQLLDDPGDSAAYAVPAYEAVKIRRDERAAQSTQATLLPIVETV